MCKMCACLTDGLKGEHDLLTGTIFYIFSPPPYFSLFQQSFDPVIPTFFSHEKRGKTVVTRMAKHWYGVFFQS